MAIHPDEAKGWVGLINSLLKTKQGVAILTSFVWIAIAGLVYWFAIRDNLIDLRQRIKDKNIEIANHSNQMKEAIEEEKKNCVKTYREYYDLFIEQQTAIEKSKENAEEMKELKRMMEELIKNQ